VKFGKVARVVCAMLVSSTGCDRARDDPPPRATDTAATPEAPVAEARPESLGVPSLDQLSRLASQKWSFDLDSLVARRVIRVLVVPSRMLYFVDRGAQKGTAYETVQEFERALNRTLRTGALPVECVFIPVARDQIFSRLAEGRGELAVAALTVTPERERVVDFSVPMYDEGREVVVTGPGAPPLGSLEDLAGREVYVRASSSHAEHIRQLNQQWAPQGRKPIVIRAADENLEDGDVLELVNAGVIPIAVVDGADADFYRPLLPSVTVRDDLVLKSGIAIAWAIRKGMPRLKAEVDGFVRRHRVGTAFGNVVARRYFEQNRWIKNPASPEQRRRFDEVMGAFERAGAEFDLDPLLLLAQGYQESGLDQRRRSSAGAVGVMQIKPSTAAGAPISITGVDRLDNNVRAGAKYLRFVIDRYYRDASMTPLDREVFAMASYNAGPARIAGLRRRAAAAGLDSNRWFGHVEVVAAREIGRETVDYVSNIYKYYLAQRLLQQRSAARERAVSDTAR
jgi:Predicted soluble lytic transglycosylase fused to an ABC-type amino acid-binding protein